MIDVVRLGDLATLIESGFACGKSNLVEVGLPHLRPFNIGIRGEINSSEIYRVPPDLAPASKSILQSGDVLFNNTNSRDLVGKLAYVEADVPAGFSNHITRVRFDRSRCEPQFAAYYLLRLWSLGYFRDWSTQWVNQAAFGPRHLANVLIPLPSLDEQRRVIEVLNGAARFERLRAQAADHLRGFISALFIKMFGDPIDNPMGWAQRHLGDVGQIQGGLQVTKKRSVLPLERPYLRVANVLRDQLFLGEIKRIRLTEGEYQRVRLERGDLLVVEGHGNAAEIGRAAIWNGSIKDCVHQNHLIRFRPDHSLINSEFSCAYLNSSSGRQRLLRRGKTTSGLNTITTSDVKACTIFVPPLVFQRRYADIVDRVRNVTATVDLGSRSASALSASLMANLLGDSASPDAVSVGGRDMTGHDRRRRSEGGVPVDVRRM